MVENLWPAPMADRPVHALVRLPGSKSITNRALVLAALAVGPSRISAPLRARDTDLMIAALRALGTCIDADGADLVVLPSPLSGPADIDCGLAGTVMRFVPPMAALATGAIRFDGDPRARERPLAPLLSALRDLGAVIDDGGRLALPLTVRGTGAVSGGPVALDASASSQFVSGLLLSGARYMNGVRITHTGPAVPSTPHIEMSLSMLRAHGVDAAAESDRVWRVVPGELRPVDRNVEPDLSNAAPFLAAAVVTGGRITIKDWPMDSLQPGGRLPVIFGAMGGSSSRDDNGLTLRGSGSVHGGDRDLREIGELTPVLAAVAALADGPSQLRGIGHLRGHETDRLAALADQINGLGGDVRQLPDGLEIRPRPLHGGTFATYDDHRLATAAAVLGLVVDGIQVENVATTDKTLPGFTDLWTDMLRGRH